MAQRAGTMAPSLDVRAKAGRIAARILEDPKAYTLYHQRRKSGKSPTSLESRTWLNLFSARAADVEALAAGLRGAAYPPQPEKGPKYLRHAFLTNGSQSLELADAALPHASTNTRPMLEALRGYTETLHEQGGFRAQASAADRAYREASWAFCKSWSKHQDARGCTLEQLETLATKCPTIRSRMDAFAATIDPQAATQDEDAEPAETTGKAEGTLQA